MIFELAKMHVYSCTKDIVGNYLISVSLLYISQLVMADIKRSAVRILHVS